MTLQEAQEAALAPKEQLTWEQVNSFARWATQQGLEVEDVQDPQLPGGHILLVHTPEHSQAA